MIDLEFVGRHEKCHVSQSLINSSNIADTPSRTGIRATEIPGLFNLLVGGTGLKLGKDSEIWTNEDALRAFLKDGICNREDIKFGDVVWVGPYRSGEFNLSQ